MEGPADDGPHCVDTGRENRREPVLRPLIRNIAADTQSTDMAKQCGGRDGTHIFRKGQIVCACMNDNARTVTRVESDPALDRTRIRCGDTL